MLARLFLFLLLVPAAVAIAEEAVRGVALRVHQRIYQAVVQLAVTF